MTVYVLSHKLDDLLEENGYDTSGPHWRRIVHICAACGLKDDPETWHICFYPSFSPDINVPSNRSREGLH